MLEKLPSAIGHLLAGVRPGLDQTVYHNIGLAGVAASIMVESPAFDDGGALPARFTEDGPGASPPLTWSNVPAGAVEVIVVIEDADSPVPAPLVHAIVYGLPGVDGRLAEGALSADPVTLVPPAATGRNSFFKSGWLPCDPPSGHGPHRYVFQVFALGARSGLDGHPGRGSVEPVLEKHALAKGVLIGTYERP